MKARAKTSRGLETGETPVPPETPVTPMTPIPPSTDTPDRYDLYEQAAQSPGMQARFLRALHEANEHEPVTLGEDFSGAGAVSRAWLALDPAHRAVCVDMASAPLARLRSLAPDESRLVIHQSNVLEATDPVDVIAALNFSIGELRTRRELMQYLTRARRRLVHEHGAPGLFVLDIYGGVDAFSIGESDIELRGGVRYIWEQREADPLSGRVVNAMHFHPRTGPEMRDAFVYVWRLWSVPELRDALTEAGFDRIAVYDRLGDAMDEEDRLYPCAIESHEELDENYVVYLAARAPAFSGSLSEPRA